MHVSHVESKALEGHLVRRMLSFHLKSLLFFISTTVLRNDRKYFFAFSYGTSEVLIKAQDRFQKSPLKLSSKNVKTNMSLALQRQHNLNTRKETAPETSTISNILKDNGI